MIATYPVGGVAWDYGQYALGLEQLGWEVFYLEDTGGPTYDPGNGLYGDECSYGVSFLRSSLEEMSPRLGDRWRFRAIDGTTHGLSDAAFAEVVASADLLINVSGSALLRDAYMRCPRKVLIDTDPGWNHFVNYPKWDSNPGWQGTHGWRSHDLFFTYAEQIGSSQCALPELGIEWRRTRPPVVMDRWAAQSPGSTWTTVMTWNNFRKPVVYRGVIYGTKEMEFWKVESLPKVCASQFELAVGGAQPPVERWRGLGWSVVDSKSVSGSAADYRSYVQSSRGEFSVGKNLYVATHSGWFSCRSACYLAAGRPVVAQDTGFSYVLPTGEGLLAFSDFDEARDAIERVEADYERHQQKAKEIARTCFDARVVLGELLGQVGL